MAALAAAAAENPALAHDATVTAAGFRRTASRARSASMTSSNATGLPPFVGARRNAGTDSIAQASDAHDARIARFSFSVRSGIIDNMRGVRKRLCAVKQIRTYAKQRHWALSGLILTNQHTIREFKGQPTVMTSASATSAGQCFGNAVISITTWAMRRGPIIVGNLFVSSGGWNSRSVLASPRRPARDVAMRGPVFHDLSADMAPR